MKSKLDLTTQVWSEFIIEDIFDVDKGIYLHSKNITSGSTPYITAKATENGLNGFIGNEKLFAGNAITIEKIKLSAFYQPHEFYCSHDVTVIRNKYLNRFNAIFICQQINRNGIKYSYGRQAQMNVVKREKILLPSTTNGNPNYKFMEEFIKEKEQIKISEYNTYIKDRKSAINVKESIENLSEKKWDRFLLSDVFTTIKRGKRLKKSDHLSGAIPYVSSTGLNNGIDGFAGNSEKVRRFKNCLTIANSGSVGATFYQPFEIIASDHVTKLENDDFNKHVYLFISTMVNRLKTKYSFNREINDKRINRESILIPINEKGNPDFDYMVKYMKLIEFRALELYLNKKTNAQQCV